MKFVVFTIFSLIIISSGLIQYSFADVLPNWIKNTAKWYGEGMISEAEFINAIEWLLNNNIITIGSNYLEQKPKEPLILSSENFEKLVEKGIEQLQLGDNEDAIIYFNEALKRNPDSVKALVDNGIAHARSGQLDEAKAIFDQAIKVGEKSGKLDYRAVVNAGIALSIYGNQTDALQYFDKVIANSNIVRQETLYAALVNKGVVLYEEGKYAEAITYYDQALEINKGKLGAIVNKANALQEMGDYKEALQWFELAYDINKDPLSWKPSFVVITE